MTSTVSAQSISTQSNQSLLELCEHINNYASGQMDLSSHMSKAMINLAKAKKSSSYGFFVSPDDLRNDFDAVVQVSSSLELTSSTSDGDALFLFSALPNRQLRAAQQEFRGMLDTIVKLALAARKMSGVASFDKGDSVKD